MKKPHIWAGIIGIGIIALNIYQGAKFIANPTDLPAVNVALSVTYLLWIALGIFLVALFLKGKHREELNDTTISLVPNSPEDIQRLSNQRRYIFVFVLLITMIGSTQVWILNNYTAGRTLINASVIFDLLFNAILFYFLIQLLRNKHDVLKNFLYAIVIYSIGSMIFLALMEHWYTAVMTIFFAFYFAFAIKAPLNRKNSRLAHLVILPVLIVLSMATPFLENAELRALSKEAQLLEQQFLNDSATVGTAYQLMLQKERPTEVDVRNVIDAKENFDTRVEEVVSNLDQLQIEFEKQLPNVAQKQVIRRSDYFREIFALSQEQANKVEEMAELIRLIDFNNFTKSEQEKIVALKLEVDTYTTQIIETQSRLNNANLVY